MPEISLRRIRTKEHTFFTPPLVFLIPEFHDSEPRVSEIIDMRQSDHGVFHRLPL